MVFRFLLEENSDGRVQAISPNNAQCHDLRVERIKTGTISTLFFPKSKQYPLSDFVGVDPYFQLQKVFVLRDSAGTPVCAVEVVGVSASSFGSITAADLTDTDGPKDPAAWKEWARETWQKPMFRGMCYPRIIRDSSVIIRVDFKVIEVFGEVGKVPSAETANALLDMLFDGLTARATPEEVLATIVKLDSSLPADFRLAAYDLIAKPRSLMPTSFITAPDLTGLVERTEGFTRGFPGLPTPPADTGSHHETVDWVEACLEALGFQSVAVTTRRRKARSGHRNGGHADFRQRLNREELAHRFPGVSVRRYRKAVRALLHLHKRALTAAAAADYARAIHLGKTRLAFLIDRDAFKKSPATAQFVAYYTARLKLRTLFTVGPQDRPMDHIAQLLLDRALADPNVRPEVIACVYCPPMIVALLDDAAKVRLATTYFAQVEWLATQLSTLWNPRWRTGTMVMRKGDNSSRWNAAARAWDQMRTGWFNVIVGAHWDDVLTEFCFGKVPSLIAGDVAAWHHHVGEHEPHHDVHVFQRLPLPWEVVLGTKECTATDVRNACAEVGIDPDATGWTLPYRQSELAVTRPTYDLVHGIMVSDPVAARWMRKAGWFAGKS